MCTFKKENFSERLKKAMEAKNMSISDLNLAVGVSYEMIRRYINGTAEPRKKVLEKICKCLNISDAWLLLGLKEKEHDNFIDTHFDSDQKLNEKKFSIEMLEITASAGNGYLNSDITKVINLIEYDYNKARHLFNGIKPLDIKIINIKGDSMEGTIECGDAIYVNVSINQFDGDGIYVFTFGRGLYVKRLQLVKNVLKVKSDNKFYDPWEIKEDEIDQLYIHGKVMLSQSMQLRKHS